MRKFTNVAKKTFTAVLCACLFFNTGLTALAEENTGEPEAEPLTTAPALTVTPVELTLTNGQFTVTQSLASAEQSEVGKAVEQINTQLLQIPCSGPSLPMQEPVGMRQQRIFIIDMTVMSFIRSTKRL